MKKENLRVDSQLLDFINSEVIPGTGIDPDNFWIKFDEAVHNLTPSNKKLIKIREEIQKKNR